MSGNFLISFNCFDTHIKMLKIRTVISLNNDQKLLITLHISMPWHGMLVLLPLLLSPIKIIVGISFNKDK